MFRRRVPRANGGGRVADYRDRFITSDGRVIDTGNGGITHTESQGYGMLLAVAHDDRSTFDRLWSWTATTLRRPEDGLFSWRYEQDVGITDTNNASDGDLLIAWALVRAGRRWGRTEDTAAARALCDAVAHHLIRQWRGLTVLLPGLMGFDHADGLVVNPSYWVFPAFPELMAVHPDGPWRALDRGGRLLLSDATFGRHGLPPDWLTLPADNAPIRPADHFEPVFGFNAVRIPLYVYWSDGSASTPAASGAVCRFWRVVGAPPPATVNLKTGETASYPASPGVQAINAVACGDQPPPPLNIEDNDYYSATLGLLAELAHEEGFQR